MFDGLILYRVENWTIEEIDNRSSEELDSALEGAFDDGTIWLGHGGILPKAFQYYHGVSGGKPFVYKYGLLTTICVLLFYIITIIKKSSRYRLTKRELIVYLFCFLLSFYKSANLFFPYYILMFFLYPYSRYLSIKSEAIEKKENNHKQMEQLFSM